MNTASPREERPKTWRSVNRFVTGRRRDLVKLAAVALFGGLVEALFLLLVTRTAFAITDDRSRFGAVAGRTLTVRSAVVIALALVVLRMVLAVIGSWQSAKLTSALIARTRTTLASSYLSASWRLQQDDQVGRLQELLTGFASRGSDLISNITLVVSSSCNLGALLVMAVLIDPPGALLVIVLVAALSSVLRPIRSLVRGRAKRSAAVGMEFAMALGEVSRMGMEMHVFNVQRPVTDRVVGLVNATADADRRLSFVRSVLPQIYTALAYVAVTAALGFAAFSDATKLESLGAVMLVMLRSLSYGQSIQTSTTAIAASLPFLEILDSHLLRYRNEPAPDGSVPVPAVGTIELRDVTFAYRPGQPVLRDMSFSIDPRTVIGIIGPSGGGKSTLVQLLLGLRTVTEGAVLVDGRPIADLSRSDWARRVTFVPQDPHLITGTIAENIRFYRDDVTSEDIEEAARLAHLHDEIMGFPEGFERHVGQRGEHLSGGQRQRVCIARALVEHPDILILDEPTSALDVRSEHHVRAALVGMKTQMTIVIIAHRLSTLDICDRLMVIQDGELKGFDTPERLARSSAFYTEILQLSGLAR
jgi:ATP-binding cassette subfamily B protein